MNRCLLSFPLSSLSLRLFPTCESTLQETHTNSHFLAGLFGRSTFFDYHLPPLCLSEGNQVRHLRMCVKSETCFNSTQLSSTLVVLQKNTSSEKHLAIESFRQLTRATASIAPDAITEILLWAQLIAERQSEFVAYENKAETREGNGFNR